jgi:hypothetical protein
MAAAASLLASLLPPLRLQPVVRSLHGLELALRLLLGEHA